MTMCECGEDATRLWDEGGDYAFWTGQPRYTPVCDACYEVKENYEPPDPDGECFRGGEAAAFAAEQAAAYRRLK